MSRWWSVGEGCSRGGGGERKGREGEAHHKVLQDGGEKGRRG